MITDDPYLLKIHGSYKSEDPTCLMQGEVLTSPCGNDLVSHFSTAAKVTVSSRYPSDGSSGQSIFHDVKRIAVHQECWSFVIDIANVDIDSCFCGMYSIESRDL